MAAQKRFDNEASTSSSSSTISDEGERPPSPTSLFEDSLFTLFSHNQPAHGDPGDVCKYTHPNLPSRYTDSSSSAPKATTLRYKVAQNSGTNTKLFAHHQWDAGLYLADLVAEQSSPVDKGKQKEGSFVDVRGRTVVELGAGTGLPGLVACAMGAERTVITDYPDPHVIDNLQRNLDLALVPKARNTRKLDSYYLHARERVQVLGLGWGNAAEEAQVFAASSGDGYDLVLAADVLWVSSAHPLLIHSIRKLLKRDRNARCALIAGFHTGHPAVGRFFQLLAQPTDANDLTLEDGRTAGIIPDWEEKRFGGIWERCIDGSQRPRSGGSITLKSDYDAGLRSQEQAVSANTEKEEEMGDISDRGSWVVVASLRWADLD